MTKVPAKSILHLGNTVLGFAVVGNDPGLLRVHPMTDVSMLRGLLHDGHYSICSYRHVKVFCQPFRTSNTQTDRLTSLL